MYGRAPHQQRQKKLQKPTSVEVSPLKGVKGSCSTSSLLGTRSLCRNGKELPTKTLLLFPNPEKPLLVFKPVGDLSPLQDTFTMALTGLQDACSNSVAKLAFKGLQTQMKFWSTHVNMSFSIL